MEKDDRGPDDVLDEAVEAGAEDVEADEEGRVVIFTDATRTMAVAAQLEERLKTNIVEADVAWVANADNVVTVEGEEERRAVMEFLEDLEGEPEVQGVYVNVNINQWN